ncbi:MAG: tetratricopeptide repeat protein [Acidimicrobiia bacterium]
MSARKALLLFALLIAFVGVTYAVRAASNRPPEFLSIRPKVDEDELGRLVDVFSARVANGGGAADVAFLGQLYLRRAELSQQIGDFELARRHLVTAAEQYPAVATLTNLAQADLSLHNFSAAEAMATDVIAVDPSSTAARAIAVDARMALGKYQQADIDLTQLERILPGHPAVTIRRAQLLFLTGDGEGAATAAEAAAQSAARLPGSDQGFYHVAAGRLWFEQGAYAKARFHLEEASRLDPNSAAALYELGRALAAEDDTSGAIEALERATNLVPEPATLALLGDLYQVVGENSLASDQYDTIRAIAALEQDPYRRAVAAALGEKGLEADLVIKLTENELGVRSDPTTWDVRAIALLNAQRIDEAYEASGRAIGPADARIWYHAGLIAAAAGHSEEAIIRLQRALDLNPRFHPVLAAHAAQLLGDLRG